MISNKLTAAAVLLAAVSAAAIAAPPDDLAAVDTAAAADRVSIAAADEEAALEEKKICRTEKATGSLTRRTRVCMTQTQWRELHDRTRRGVGDMQNSASGSPACISAMDVACGAPSAAGSPGGM